MRAVWGSSTPCVTVEEAMASLAIFSSIRPLETACVNVSLHPESGSKMAPVDAWKMTASGREEGLTFPWQTHSSSSSPGAMDRSTSPLSTASETDSLIPEA